MLLGKIESDARGFIIRTTDTLWSEPTLVETVYRVTGINDPYRRLADGMVARYQTGDNSVWRGDGSVSLACESMPETVTQTPIPPPKGKRKHVWRDGAWRRVS